MSKTIILKTWPDFFELMWFEHKTFEHRKNDRDFREGDFLILKEWNPRTKQFTGRAMRVLVTLLVTEAPGLRKGYCIMQTKALDWI